MVMLTEKPVTVSNAARRSADYAGEVAIAALPRLAGVVADSQRDAQGVAKTHKVADGLKVVAHLTFSEHHKPGFAALQGEVNVEVELVCQRCLQLARHAIDFQLALALVDGSRDEDYLEDAPERFERWDCTDDQVFLGECIDEMALLELPLVAMHADKTQCGALAQSELTADEEKTHTPFAALASMLSKDKH